MRLFWNNLVDADATTLTASSEHPNLPVQNLAHEFIQNVWKTGTAQAEEFVVVDLAVPQTLSALILASHDFKQTDNPHFQFSNDPAFTGAPEIPIEWRADTMLALFAPVEVRYVRVLFTKGAANETRQLGRLFVGDHYECEQEPEHKGYREQPVDLSKKSRSLGGQTYCEARPQYRELRIPFDEISGSQAGALLDIARAVGTHTAFFIQVQDSLAGLNRDVLDEAVYVKFKDLADREVRGVDESLLWKMQLDLEEQL